MRRALAVLTSTLPLATVTLAATVLVAEGAGASSCRDPAQWLSWSYPDATTEVVPPDAVFRAFTHQFKVVSFELDGVVLVSTAVKALPPLMRQGQPVVSDPVSLNWALRDTDAFGTSEFVPSEPLAPGEHEVVIKILKSTEAPPPEVLETHRFQFRVGAVPLPAAATQIARVTWYMWDYQGGRKEGVFPPPVPLNEACPGVINIADPYCDYPTFGHSTLVELEGMAAPEPGAAASALGYFIGNTLVPVGCDTFYMKGASTPEARTQPGAYAGDGPVELEAILPSGLGAPQAFEGEVEVLRDMREPVEYDYADPPAWGCALGGGSVDRPGATSHGEWASWSLLAFAALQRRRRSLTARA